MKKFKTVTSQEIDAHIQECIELEADKQAYIKSVLYHIEYCAADQIEGKEMTIKERLSLLAFSMLADIDGEGGTDLALALKVRMEDGKDRDIGGDLHSMLVQFEME